MIQQHLWQASPCTLAGPNAATRNAAGGTYMRGMS